MPKQNFLIGRGERLTEDVTVKSKPSPKQHPYSFDEAQQRLTPMLKTTSREIDALPANACPNNQAIISLTLNPEYIAKSYFPQALLRHVGIEVVGSRPTTLKPEKRSKEREPEKALTTQLFARGHREAFRDWTQSMPGWDAADTYSQELVSIERITAPSPKSKIKGSLPTNVLLPMEVVLHSDAIEGEMDILAEFGKYLESLQIAWNLGKKFYAQGLCFIELEAPTNQAEAIATFSIVRALRAMPALRVLRPTIRSSTIPSSNPELPPAGPISNDIRVAIFDGGIPPNHPLTEWVTAYESEDLGPATADLNDHGVQVTSAALFGHIDPELELPRPFSSIDHYRVLDDDPEEDYLSLYKVLARIDGVLTTERYDFINLSIGPRLPIDDDEVHAWTAVLDDRLARIPTLATIAVGNDGESDHLAGLNRIQVPADCVNALAIGSCNSTESEWSRAAYSSIGPGRSPGVVKPDLVAFGGDLLRPFVAFGGELSLRLTATGGTSFAAPSVTRIASGIRAHLGSSINHLAIRALLIHSAESTDSRTTEIGRGRCAQDVNDVVLCSDDEIRIVYQGEISPSKYIRASIPVPHEEMSGMVQMKATLCYKTLTDPHHPGNYTRAGLEVTFRPHDGRFSKEKQLHPNSAPFFGSSVPGLSEVELRRDALKWENCLHATKRMRGASLSNPVFDIHYNARLESRNFRPDSKLPYALVVSVQAKGVVDLYDKVIRKYATILEPLRPVLEVPIRT